MTSVHNGLDGLERAIEGDYQVVILDCLLPGIDGFEVLRRLRRVSTVPVLMLTALGDESDRIVGLELGADDYLPKTFSTRELLARLRAVTRRSAITASLDRRRGDGAAALGRFRCRTSSSTAGSHGGARRAGRSR